jgi:hypothetical protein
MKAVAGERCQVPGFMAHLGSPAALAPRPQNHLKALFLMNKMELDKTHTGTQRRSLRHLAGALMMAVALAWASPAPAAPPSPAPVTNQAQNNRPYLLVFPVIVLGIIGALVVITRKKK